MENYCSRYMTQFNLKYQEMIAHTKTFHLGGQCKNLEYVICISLD